MCVPILLCFWAHICMKSVSVTETEKNEGDSVLPPGDSRVRIQIVLYGYTIWWQAVHWCIKKGSQLPRRTQRCPGEGMHSHKFARPCQEKKLKPSDHWAGSMTAYTMHSGVFIMSFKNVAYVSPKSTWYWSNSGPQKGIRNDPLNKH